MSYANVIMYCATLPSYARRKDGKGPSESKVNGDDPSNNGLLDKIIRNQ